MAEIFDPYVQWLGIRDPKRPPNHYRLLGLEPFETDPEVILNAADRQMMHIRRFQGGKHSVESQQLLNELAAAKICLLDAEKKALYDAALRSKPTPPPVVRPGRSVVPPPIPDLSHSASGLPDFNISLRPTLDFGKGFSSEDVSIPSMPRPLAELHGQPPESPDDDSDYEVRLRGSRLFGKQKGFLPVSAILSMFFALAAISIILFAVWWVANNK